jgi:hypothetical protein
MKDRGAIETQEAALAGIERRAGTLLERVRSETARSLSGGA